MSYTEPYSGEKSTEHIITILAETDEGREVMRTLLYWKFGMLGQLSVQAHKEKFGRQSYCLTTHRRFWVWERSRQFFSQLTDWAGGDPQSWLPRELRPNGPGRLR